MIEDVNDLEKAFKSFKDKSSDDLSKEFDELVNKEKLENIRFVLDNDEDDEDDDYDDYDEDDEFDDDDYCNEENELDELEYSFNNSRITNNCESTNDLDLLEKSFENFEKIEIEKKIGVKINNEEPINNSLAKEFQQIKNSINVEKSNGNPTLDIEEKFKESLIKPVSEVTNNQNLIKKLLILQII